MPRFFSVALVAAVTAASFFNIAIAQDRFCSTTNICFAIDESRSISAANFVTQSSAVNEIANQFLSISPESAFSAVGFSDNGHRISALTTDLDAFKAALLQNKQRRSSTGSGAGLRLCQTLLHSAAAPRVVVLLSMGADNTGKVNRGTAVAPALKAEGITIVTVGVGSDFVRADLVEVASRPDLYVEVENFAALPEMIDDIASILCVDPTPSPTPTPSGTPTPTPTTSASATPSVSTSLTPTPSSSVTPTLSPSMTPIVPHAAEQLIPSANMCFAIDVSGSINAIQVNLLSAAIIKIVTEFSELSPYSAYSAVSFWTEAKIVSPLTENRRFFLSTITRIKKQGGATASGTGVLKCFHLLKNGNRPGVIVLMSHATDNRHPKGADVASAIQEAGIYIVTVAIGSGADEDALADIATSPSLTFVAGDFLLLRNKKATKIAKKIAANIPLSPNCGFAGCTTSPSPSPVPSQSPSPSPSTSPSASPSPSPSPSPTLSLSPSPSPSSSLSLPSINVCFAIDESGPINAKQFELHSKSIAQIVELLGVSTDSAYSAVGFWSGTQVLSPLTKDRKLFIAKIMRNTQHGGATSSGAGLRKCFHLLKNGNLPNVVVLFSANSDSRSPKGVRVAPLIKQAGMSIITVAIGIDANKTALTRIASSPSLAIITTDINTEVVDEKIIAAVPRFPKCGFVDCARCGGVLECYANSESRAWNWWASRRVANSEIFCRRRKDSHILTKCEQSCDHLSQGIRVVRGQRFASCPKLYITEGPSRSSCLGGGERVGSGSYTPHKVETFASYKLCRSDSSHLTIRCVQKECKSGVCTCHA